MKRFDLIDIEEADGTLTPSVEEVGDSGRFVLYEDAKVIADDRDIKAANLQLLVGKVLADPDSLWAEHEMAAEANAMWDEIVELARGLKQ